MAVRFRALLGVASAVTLITGCSGTAGEPVEVVDQYRGRPAQTEVIASHVFPPDAEVPEAERLELAWLTDGTFAVSTWWSGTCPKVPSRLLPDAGGVLLTIEPEPAYACTDDLAQTTTVISPPRGWTPESSLQAAADGEAWKVSLIEG
ncbi:hypothetical protein [Desertivibrio insolitus]|uniref:hypothetical protein n=1 Tax=Herbiconiux sp. SYSU D00978 TaxID=2812562 RepID=UPI001A9641DF|nr:hypothetical protein [Herbiconiux sp. SYSU D00978]